MSTNTQLPRPDDVSGIEDQLIYRSADVVRQFYYSFFDTTGEPENSYENYTTHAVVHHATENDVFPPVSDCGEDEVNCKVSGSAVVTEPDESQGEMFQITITDQSGRICEGVGSRKNFAEDVREQVLSGGQVEYENVTAVFTQMHRDESEENRIRGQFAFVKRSP